MIVDILSGGAGAGQLRLAGGKSGGMSAGLTYTCPDCGRGHIVLWLGQVVEIQCPCGATITVKPWSMVKEVFPWLAL